MPPTIRPVPRPAVTSSGLWAPTNTRPNITSRVSSERNPPPTDRQRRRDDRCDRGDEDDVTRRETGARTGHVGAAQDRADLARAGALADGEVVGHLPPDELLGAELAERRDHDPGRHPPVADHPGDGEPHQRSDHEVAQLHRQPQRPVQPVRQTVHCVEDAGLAVADRRTTSLVDRRREDREADRRDDEPPEVHDASRRRRSSSRPGRCFNAVRVRAAQRPRLEPGDGTGQRVVIDGRQGRHDRTFGADVDARRADELGDVVGEQQLGGGHLAEPEVDDPHRAVGAEEHVREAQVTMGDPVAAQVGDCLPDGEEDLVGDVVRVELIERLAGHCVVGEHERVRLGRRKCPQARCTDAEVASGEREQRLVLDGAAQRRERSFVAEVAALQLAVDPEHEVGAAFVLAEDLHEQPIAARHDGEVRRRSACIDTRRCDLVDREADCGEPGGDRLGVGASCRRTDRHERSGSGEPPEERCLDRTERHLRREGPHHCQPDHGGPSGAAPASVQPGRTAGQCRREHPDADCRREPAGCEEPQIGVGRRHDRALVDVGEVGEQRHEDRSDDAAECHGDRRGPPTPEPPSTATRPRAPQW